MKNGRQTLLDDLYIKVKVEDSLEHGIGTVKPYLEMTDDVNLQYMRK